MDLSIQRDNGEVVQIRAAGRITQEQSVLTKDLLSDLLGTDVYSRQLILDMQEAEYLDSSGIAWLVGCHKKFRQHGGRVVLHSLTPIVLNAIKVLRLQLLLELADNEEEALKRVKDES